MARAARWTAVAFLLASVTAWLAEGLWPRANPGPIALLAAGLVLLAAGGPGRKLASLGHGDSRAASPAVAPHPQQRVG